MQDNQISPKGQRFASNGARWATFTGNAGVASPVGNLICSMDRRFRTEGRKYQRLFFLDEATALAAGHRPCFSCRRAAFNSFKTAWVAAGFEGGKILNTDRVIAAERGGTHLEAGSSLPTGVFIDVDGEPQLVVEGHIRAWSPSGYGPSSPLPPGDVATITPASIVATIREGYQPEIHRSAK